MPEYINYDTSEYDIKKVPLGEAVSKTIGIIDNDIRKLEEKKVNKELATEQTDPENPRYKVLSDNNLTDEFVQDIIRSRVYHIEIYFRSGVFDEVTFQKLTSNNLSDIIYNNCHYKLAYKDNITRRYICEFTLNDCIQNITIDNRNRSWLYNLIGNQVLVQHINNNDIHIQNGEREYWNNKVTCDINGELLIFTKDNI